MKYLVTGVAGFIGFHLTKRLIEMNETVIGIDNLNDYYDVRWKYTRLNELGIENTNLKSDKRYHSKKVDNFQFIKIDIADKIALSNLFEKENFNIVCNFAAQAGIMYSTKNPNAYIHSNILGFINILECCKKYHSKLIYASSSSVYGENNKIPFSETDTTLVPKNLYARTKIQNEQLAQIYSDYFGLHTIGLRLFSVYGSFGRPDMGYMIFSQAIQHQESINIYGDGNAKRDYTFVEDVINSIIKLKDFYMNKRAANEIFNIGSEKPISLLELITILEEEFRKKSSKNFLKARVEEIEITFAETTKLEQTINYKPNTLFKEGIKEFIKWYKSMNLS